jgi:hypothetical protein
LAATHGVGQVARTLRLDYNKLKRQVAPGPAHSVPIGPPAFVELPSRELWPHPSTVCRVELSDPAGTKMTVELPCDPAIAMGLAQAWWRRR